MRNIIMIIEEVGVIDILTLVKSIADFMIMRNTDLKNGANVTRVRVKNIEILRVQSCLCRRRP